jgi:hypothetical protein
VLRLLSIGLISLLLYQSAGFVVTFELGVSAIRKEVREKLIQKGEGSVVRLAFHRSAHLAFKDEGKEIYHQNNMYDILRQEVKGDSLILTCFHDVAESELVAAFEEEVKDITDQAQSKNKHKSVHKKYEYVQHMVSKAPAPTLLPLTKHQTSVDYHLSTPHLHVFSPPPEFS